MKVLFHLGEAGGRGVVTVPGAGHTSVPAWRVGQCVDVGAGGSRRFLVRVRRRNKTPETGECINNRHLFLSSEAGKCKLKAPAGLGLERPSLRFQDGAWWLRPHMARGAEGQREGRRLYHTSYEVLNLVLEVLPLPKGPGS